MNFHFSSKILSLAAALFFISSTLHAEVSLFPLFQDHAVLQQEMKVPIWGKAAPGEDVTVSFHNQKLSTKADTQGQWRVELAPMKFSTEPAELVVQGSNNIALKDILVGEVWLCSGQSNMEFPLNKSEGGEAALAEANLPLIRQFKVFKKASEEPLDTVTGKWVVSSPATSGGFTAVGFYFARDINKQLGVPVGILQSAVSGTQIETWVSKATAEDNPKLAPIIQRVNEANTKFPEANAAFPEKMAAWQKESEAAKTAGTPFKTPKPNPPMGPGNDNWPFAFYNGMIHPIATYAIRGALWYQGESNTGRVDEYRDVLPAMITLWRGEWKQGDFPFYIVQLPSYGPSPAGWSGFRAAQASALSLPNTEMAVTIDIGREAENLHPTNKVDVGIRLAAIAKAKVYKVENTEFTGPVLEKAEKEGNSIRLTFSHSTGMAPKGDKLAGFEIAGDDKKYVPAEATLEANGTILVSSAKVPTPAYVQYAWWASGANLYNAAGLPAAPFRSENPGTK